MTVDIEKFSGCRILVVGDLMIDHYVWGEVDRISPEAPVQVVSVSSEDDTLGGCGNVVNNLVALGARVSVAGVTGTGVDGKLLREKFRQLGVDTSGVIGEADRPTTRKTRIFAANQHVLRIDRETRKEISAATADALSAAVEKMIPDVDVILISDYSKGVVTAPLLVRITAEASAHGKWTIADPKGKDFSKYAGVSLLTPNRKEAALASGMPIADDATMSEAAKKVVESAGVAHLLVTCGKDGMVLYENGVQPVRIPAEARQVYEVSGAGDTVLAVLGLSIASGASLRSAAALANTAAGIVVGKVGTATITRKELMAALKPYSEGAAMKHRTFAELPLLVQELRKKGKRVVLTNGCFDLIHAGHIMLFSASRQLGDVLIVATDDDDSVRAFKGQGRPVIHARERVRILSALDSIDYVVVFSSGQLEELIETVRPDVLTKGSNYASEEVAGRELVESFGGRVVRIPITEAISATQIINTIKQS